MIDLEIGGGTLCQEGWENLDPRHGSGVWRRKAEIREGGLWPTVNDSVRAIRASHVLEHILAGEDRIGIFNEAHRVLAPGGTFEVILPLMVGTWHAIADPTHVSFWCRESFLYFCPGAFRPNADYGIKLWEEVSWSVVNGWEGHWKGTPIK